MYVDEVPICLACEKKREDDQTEEEFGTGVFSANVDASKKPPEREHRPSSKQPLCDTENSGSGTQ